MYLLDNLNPRPDVFSMSYAAMFFTPQIIRRRPDRYDTDNTLENLTVEAATGEGTWMFSGTIPYMVYWGLKLISPEYILIAAFFLTSVVSVCTGTSWGSAGTVGVALMGVAAGLDVSLAAAAGAVVSGAYFGDKISPLSDSTNFAAIVADTTLFEYSALFHLPER